MEKEKIIDLIKLLKKGDVKAFDNIYNLYCIKLFKFVFRYVKLVQDAEGIVQEVFITLWETKDRVDIQKFDSYLFTITYNKTISLLRKRMSEKRSLEYLKLTQQNITSADIIDEIHYLQLTENLRKLVDRLTPRQREIFLLSREKGLTHKEISEMLNISENTIKNHLVSALAYIKSHLDE